MLLIYIYRLVFLGCSLRNILVKHLEEENMGGHYVLIKDGTNSRAKLLKLSKTFTRKNNVLQ